MYVNVTRSNLSCTLQGPGGIQVLKRWKIAVNHLFSRVNDMSTLVFGSGSSVPDGDGGGED